MPTSSPSSVTVPSPGLPTTRGALRADGRAAHRGIKQELRDNLVTALARGEHGEALFPGLIGYGDTVIPQVVNAILAGHDLLLLGLRGQAKTRLARALMRFLDPVVPALAGRPTALTSPRAGRCGGGGNRRTRRRRRQSRVADA